VFSEAQSHYLFEDQFFRPGKGNDKGKGKVEGLVRVSERMCNYKQVSVSLPFGGSSHDDQFDDYTGVA
jgi:hypothetical protein